MWGWGSRRGGPLGLATRPGEVGMEAKWRPTPIPVTPVPPCASPAPPSAAAGAREKGSSAGKSNRAGGLSANPGGDGPSAANGRREC